MYACMRACMYVYVCKVYVYVYVYEYVYVFSRAQINSTESRDEPAVRATKRGQWWANPQ